MENTEILMRRARMADAADIGRICASQDPEGLLEPRDQPLEDWQEWLASRDRRHPVFVGTRAGEVLCWAALGPGFPQGRPFEWTASAELGLPAQLEGTELTDLLLRFLEGQAQRLGYYKLTACIPARRRYLLHVYRRAGYRDVGLLRGHGYCRGELLDMALLERLLPPDLSRLEEQYSRRWPAYREYFEEERRRAQSTAAPAPEYVEVETPEGQLPEGIVRFLRVKKPGEAVPSRPTVRAASPAPETAPELPAELEEAPENPGEEASQLTLGEASSLVKPAAPGKAPLPPVRGSQAAEAGLPEGILRFLRSKKAPDGTPLPPELLPPVPAASPAPPEEERAPAPLPAPSAPISLSEESDPQDQLSFEDK